MYKSVKKTKVFYALDLKIFKITNQLFLHKNKILILWKKALTLNLGFFYTVLHTKKTAVFRRFNITKNMN